MKGQAMGEEAMRPEPPDIPPFAQCGGSGTSSETTLEQLRRVASELENQMCSSFPHLICNEVQGLAFKQWCEPCKARAVMQAIRKSESQSPNGGGQRPPARPQETK